MGVAYGPIHKNPGKKNHAVSNLSDSYGKGLKVTGEKL